MQNFNTTRTLFPAYSDISDVRVALPSPPSRARVARDLNDLWEIHQSEPHITPLSDPGVDAPLPMEDGFDPNGLSDNSPENILVNRIASHATKSELSSFEDALRKIYPTILDANRNLKGTQVGALKNQIMSVCPGALLVYNMNDPQKLIQALSLVQALQKLSVDLVDAAEFPDETKEQLISYIGKSPSLRKALLLPNFSIQQKLLGNTESYDNLSEALSLLGKLPTSNPAQEIVVNDEFQDHRDAVSIAETLYNARICYDIACGLARKAILRSLNCVKAVLVSKDAAQACAQLINHVEKLNHSVLSVNSDKLCYSYGKVKKTLEDISAAPSAVSAIDQKISDVKVDCKQCTPVPIDPKLVVGPLCKVSQDSLQRSISNLNLQIANLHAKLQPIDKASAAFCGICIELACLKSFVDCCESLKNKSSCDYNLLCQRLYQDVVGLLKRSSDPKLTALRRELESCQNSLETAQNLKTITSLKKANSENIISDKKLEILTKILG